MVGFSLPPSVKAHTTDMVRDTYTHILTYTYARTFTHTPNEGLDRSWWKDSAGGCTFIKPRLDLFMFEVIWARERSLCAQTHTYTHFLITLASVFSLFHKTYWHVSIQQARYRTNGQFYLSLCSGKSIPLNIGQPLFGPVSPTQSKSHFEMTVTHAINHSTASQWPITFSFPN